MQETASQKLKKRVMKIKAKLPRLYTPVIIKNYPEYDTVAGRTKINNVVGLKGSDERLTNILEELFKRKGK